MSPKSASPGSSLGGVSCDGLLRIRGAFLGGPKPVCIRTQNFLSRTPPQTVLGKLRGDKRKQGTGSDFGASRGGQRN